jgi:hypothetical protein
VENLSKVEFEPFPRVELLFLAVTVSYNRKKFMYTISGLSAKLLHLYTEMEADRPVSL